MKRFLVVLLLFVCFINADAQNLTLWYGLGYCGEWKQLHNGFKKSPKWRGYRFGVDYSMPVMRNVDWTAGLGYNKKSTRASVSYLQVETNLGYKIVELPKTFSLTVLAGPYFGILVDDDREYWLGGHPEFTKILTGLQTGIKMDYRRLSLKLGFEGGLVPIHGENMVPRSVPYEFFTRLGLRL